MRRLLALPLLLVVTTASYSQSPAVSSAQTAPGAASPAAPLHLGAVKYVMLGVADLQRSVDFYRGTLGLKVSQQGDDLAFFDAGSIQLVVSTEVGRAPGDSEIVFAVDHVRAAFQALSGAGVHFDRAPHSLTPTDWAASFHDPDGHVLSVFGPE